MDEEDNIPNAVAPDTSNVSDIGILKHLNPSDGKDEITPEFFTNFLNRKDPTEAVGSGVGGGFADIEQASNVQVSGGQAFDEDYTGTNIYRSDNIDGLLAQGQSNNQKRLSGLGRLVGEFAVNVAEIPGVVGGAIGAAVTGDISKITDNFWVRYTDGLKGDLQEALPVYQRQAVTEGGVLDKMMSIDWWATEGASGAAFMAAAFMPGLGLAKVPKGLSISANLAKSSSKWAPKVLGHIDDVVKKVGLVSKKAGQLHKADRVKSAVDLVNMTLMNSVYEAGVEARSTKDGYTDQLRSKLNNDEISYEEFEKLSVNSSIAARNTFAGNMALLLIPNLAMNKMLLGSRQAGYMGKTLNKMRGKVNTNNVQYNKAANAFQKAKKTPYDGIGKKGYGAKLMNNRFAQKGAAWVGGGAKNLVREGFMEEGGQGALEQYWSEGFIDAQMDGERERNIAETYSDFISTTDGQVAVLFGGLLGAPVATWSRFYKEPKTISKIAEDTIKHVGSGLNYYEATRKGFYKRDDNGDFELNKDNNLIPDLSVQADMADAKKRVEYLEGALEIARENGDIQQEEIILNNLQAQAMVPFIQLGDTGLDLMEEMMKENPVTQMTVDNINKESGSKITVEDYVREEIAKAKDLMTHMDFHRDSATWLTSKSFEKRKGIEDTTESDLWRADFNRGMTGEYGRLKHMDTSLSNRTTKLNTDIEDAKERKATDVIAKLKEEKRKVVRYQKDITKSLSELTDFEAINSKWESFYNGKVRTKKINNDEVTGYLTEFMADVTQQTSEQGVLEVIAKAKEDGLFLAEVKLDKLPANLLKMVESDDFLEATIAVHSLNQFIGDTDATLVDNVRNKATANLSRINKNMFEVVDTIAKNTDKHLQALKELQEQEEAELNKLTEAQSRIDVAISNMRDLEVDQTVKGKKLATRTYNKNILDLRKEEVKASAEIAKLSRQQAEIKNSIIDTHDKVKDNFTILYQLYDKLPSNLVRSQVLNSGIELGLVEDIDDQLTFIKELRAHKSAPIDLFTKMPISLNELRDAVVASQKVMLESGVEIGELAVDLSALDLKQNKLKYLRATEAIINHQKNYIKSAISKYEKVKNTKYALEAVTEFEKELLALDEELELVSDQISKLSDSASEGIQMNMEKWDSFVEGMENMIQTVTDLLGGKQVKAEAVLRGDPVDSVPTPIINIKGKADLLKVMDSKITLYNETGSSQDIEKFFGNMTNDSVGDVGVLLASSNFTDRMHVLDSYLSYVRSSIERNRDTSSKRVIKTFKSYNKKSYDAFSNEVISDTFTPLEDITNGEGISRVVDEIVMDAFKAVFATSELTVRDYLKGQSALITDKGVINVQALNNISIVIKMHPSLWDSLSKEAQEIVSGQTLGEDDVDQMFGETSQADRIWDQYNNLGNEDNRDGAVITIKKAPKRKKTGNKIIDAINDTNIAAELYKFIDAKVKSIKDQALAQVRKLANDKVNSILGNEPDPEAIVAGDKVNWEINGKNETGEVIIVLATDSSAANAYVQTDSGLHVVNTAKLSKKDRSVDSSIETTYNEFVDRSNKDFKLYSKKDSMGAPILWETKETNTFNEENEITTTTAKFKEYAESTRDKSKDPVNFSFNLGRARDSKHGKSDEIKKRDQRLVKIFDEANAGKGVTKDDRDFFIDNVHISMRVEWDNTSAGSFIPAINQTNADQEINFNTIERPIRERIFQAWQSNNYQTETAGVYRNKIPNIQANFSWFTPGQLNFAQEGIPADGYKVTDLKGVTQENIELFFPMSETTQEAYNKIGDKIQVPFNTEGRLGLPHVKVKANTAEDYYLPLRQKTLLGEDEANTPELDLIMEVYEEILTNNVVNLQNNVSDKVLNKLKKEIPLLHDAFGTDAIPYNSLLDTMLYHGEEDSQYGGRVIVSKGKLKIGTHEWTSETFSKNKSTIRATVGQKYHRTGVTNPLDIDTVLTIKNPKYLKYLLESKIMNTTIKPNEAIFVAVQDPKNPNYAKGAQPKLRAEDIKFTTKKIVVPQKKAVVLKPTQETSEVEVKKADIDALLAKEKTIKIGRYTPSARFADRVSGETVQLEVEDALSAIVSFTRGPISKEQISQLNEILDLFFPVLSIKKIDALEYKFENEVANFFEIIDALTRIKIKKQSQARKQAKQVKVVLKPTKQQDSNIPTTKEEARKMLQEILDRPHNKEVHKYNSVDDPGYIRIIRDVSGEWMSRLSESPTEYVAKKDLEEFKKLVNDIYDNIINKVVNKKPILNPEIREELELQGKRISRLSDSEVLELNKNANDLITGKAIDMAEVYRIIKQANNEEGDNDAPPCKG